MDDQQQPQAENYPAQPVTKRSKRSRKRIAASIFTIVLCFIAAAAGTAVVLHVADKQNDSRFGVLYAKDDGNKIVSEGEQTIASVVDKVSPSVVSIITSTSTNRRGFAEQAAGTGMIVTSDGYVLTNKHVVSGATDISISTSDGETYEDVKLVGSDPLNDIAFLKIDGVRDLPSVTLGDSKTVRTGQTVIAIGNALGQYQNTVTSGIISGLGRPVVASDGGNESESLNDLLQIDAAINSGNSGGPLLNSSGQVIGINTAVAQDAQGIGFAIPIGAAKGMLEQLIATGKVERAFVGVQYLSVTPEVKAEYDLSVSRGDYIVAMSVEAVKSGSPADKAGLKEGDIITKVNDQETGPGKGVSTLVGEYKSGDKVTLTILRDGKTQTKQVTLSSY